MKQNVRFLLITAALFLSASAVQALPDISGEPLAGEGKTNSRAPVSNTMPRVDITEPGTSPLRLSGELETGAHFALPPLGVWAEEWQIVKTEGRLRLRLDWKKGPFTARIIEDNYYYPDFSGDPSPHGNEMVIRQAWAGATGEKLGVKLGWQLFAWGNADLFPTVNALDRSDFRDLANLDRTQRYFGTFGLSARLMTGSTALEMALLPAAQPAAIPSGNAFWRSRYDDMAGLEVRDTPAAATAADFSSAAAAFRWGGSAAGLDFHISWYYGPQRGLLFLSVLTGTNAAQASMEKRPVSRRVHLFALNTAITAGKAAIRLEAAFSPAMTAVNSVTATDITAVTNLLAPGNSEIGLNSAQRAPYLSWTVGTDFPFLGGDGRLFLEWKQDMYLDDNGSREAFRISDIAAVLYSRSFLSERIKLQTGAVLTRRDGEFLGAAGYRITFFLTENAWITQETLFLAGTAGLSAGCRF